MNEPRGFRVLIDDAHKLYLPPSATISIDNIRKVENNDLILMDLEAWDTQGSANVFIYRTDPTSKIRRLDEVISFIIGSDVCVLERVE
ncbi:MAG: hypothetical protein V4436_01565 [Patescibacteria group bacterium]